MNIPQLLEQVKHTASYELYRLAQALMQECARPERVRAVLARLRPGMKIRYFDASLNRDLEAEVIELRQSLVNVRNLDDGKHWLIQTASINLEGVAMDAPISPNRKLTRAELSVGMKVGFLDRQNQEVVAVIERLNSKTATLRSSCGHLRWRVSYSLLFPVVATAEAQAALRIQPAP